MSNPCPFCRPAPERVFHQGEHVVGVWDAFPVTDSHALLVTRRHVASWFDATDAERAELAAATLIAKRHIEARRSADGYNVGINVADAAGQTVPHLHVHVIPRRHGDVSDPRGGVRFVIPEKANYLAVAAGAAPSSDELVLLSTGGERPLFPNLVSDVATSDQVDIAVAFVSPSGVDRIYDHFADLLTRGGRLRLLTGDYLDITDPDALQQLLDLTVAYGTERVELRIFVAGGTSFHPKAYILKRSAGREGVAYVGSSNLSKSALEDGVEWNYRIVTARDARGFGEITRAFDALFSDPATRPLDQSWLTQYRLRRVPPVATPVDVVAEPSQPPPDPNPVQQEALAALSATRSAGFTAGLVVMATGIGKTWLAAFDSRHDRYRRVLFVAHREEILEQAMKTFRRVRPRATFGHYNGTVRDGDADVVFASIQTLGRASHLSRFDRDAFDYIVVDEFHHAAAQTYRRLIEHFRPKFLLGLTATPERTDGGDLLALCQDNLVYRRDLPDGVRLGLLSPFQYFGVPDEVDYSNIPWRSARFDEEELTSAVATQRRAQNALEQWRTHGGGRTLGFCVSQRHADFMRDFFRGNGVRAASVHAGAGSDPRTESVEKLAAGELDVIFAVDVFNEGVDIPSIETVLMLRPTESQIIWLQQIGRGLRKLEGKRLRIIDYIGNHRVFLVKVRTLLQLGPGNDEAIAAALAKVQRGDWELPPGCEVTYDLKAIEILRSLLRTGGSTDALRDYYVDFRDRVGVRPTAAEAFHEQYSPRATHSTYGSWLGFVDHMGDLDEAHRRALRGARGLLRSLEVTPLTKSYKLLVVRALVDAGAFPAPGLKIDELVRRVREMAARDPRVAQDLGRSASSDAALRKALEGNPISAWVGAKGTDGVPQFTYEGGVFRAVVDVPAEDRPAVSDLVDELLEWRLAEYFARPGGVQAEGSLTMPVADANGLVLRLPRADAEGVPSGWQPVVVDGRRLRARFDETEVRTLGLSEGGDNELPAILRTWFGSNAGRPGTRNEVVATETDDGAWALRPGDVTVRALSVWNRYSREQIPPLFGETFSKALWNVGFVTRPAGTAKTVWLLVTLDKDDIHNKAFEYEDRFLSPDRFQWQSQNRTARDSTAGALIRDHESRGVPVHLFVRPEKKIRGNPAPFVYCGQVRFEDWKGDEPITVRWRLLEPVPERLWSYLRVPPST